MKQPDNKNSISIAWTGASGAPYGLKLVKYLLKADYRVFLMISSAARVVLATEENIKLSANPDKAQQQLLQHFQNEKGELIVLGKEDWFSAPASGSGAPKQMVICPCSTGTLAAIAMGMSNSLLERAADVVLKEKGQLLLVPRETPLNTIHLEHMLSLSKLGAMILPAAPGFYHDPKSITDLIDFIVARILDHLNIEHSLTKRWGYANDSPE